MPSEPRAAWLLHVGSLDELAQYCAFRREIERLDAEVGRLEDKLRAITDLFPEHRSECSLERLGLRGGPCTCGLGEVLHEP